MVSSDEVVAIYLMKDTEVGGLIRELEKWMDKTELLSIREIGKTYPNLFALRDKLVSISNKNYVTSIWR